MENGISQADLKQDIDLLLPSSDPCIRYKVLVNVLGKDPQSPEIVQLQQEIKESPRIKGLLSERDESGKITQGVYSKWRGAHWVLSLLADNGYPSGDSSLLPLREQEYGWLLSDEHLKMVQKMTINGRMRRCASQEGNAIYSLLSLGIADSGVDELAGRLMRWQWQDGGWNCDKHPEAINSSFFETLIPMRALALYARRTGSSEAAEAARRASEVFLKRHLFKRQHDGAIIRSSFLKLHYPCYWRYDILTGLKVMAEAGFIHDERCMEALAILKSKRLLTGGYPAEAKFYGKGESARSTRSLVDWGPVGVKKMNEYVSADALFVLVKAGQL